MKFPDRKNSSENISATYNMEIFPPGIIGRGDTSSFFCLFVRLGV